MKNKEFLILKKADGQLRLGFKRQVHVVGKLVAQLWRLRHLAARPAAGDLHHREVRIRR